MHQYLDLIKILNSSKSIMTMLAGDSEELQSTTSFSVKMKDVDNQIFTFSSECLLNNNIKQQRKHTVSLSHIFQNCKGGSYNVQDNNYT